MIGSLLGGHHMRLGMSEKFGDGQREEWLRGVVWGHYEGYGEAKDVIVSRKA